MNSTFEGRSVLVTGGSQGIGKTIAAAFAAQNARVFITARDPGQLQKTALELKSLGGSVEAISADVTDLEQVGSLFQKVQDSVGPVDILVNNAGAAESHPFVDHPDELWERMLAINLTGTFYVCRIFAPPMLERKNGRIINIASTAGKVGGKYIAAYTAAKHGVLGLTRSMAAEFAALGVTVNAICPGYVATPMTERTIANIVERTGRSKEDAIRTLQAMSPQNRFIEPAEIAHVALMLAADEAAGINGQAINVDGGSVMD